jgi:hypothetical protein
MLHVACRVSQKEACALKRMAKKMQMLLASFMQHQDNLFESKKRLEKWKPSPWVRWLR